MIELRDLQEDDLPTAARVLARAFAADGIVANLVSPQFPERSRMLERMFHAVGTFRVRRRQPMLGAFIDGEMVGAIGANVPDALPWTDDLQAMWDAIELDLDEDSRAAMAAYDEILGQHRVDVGYIVAIGVDPAHQGAGIGRAMLAAMHDRLPRPIGLHTDGEPNRRFYERYGYTLRHSAMLGETEVLYMVLE